MKTKSLFLLLTVSLSATAGVRTVGGALAIPGLEGRPVLKEMLEGASATCDWKRGPDFRNSLVKFDEVLKSIRRVSWGMALRIWQDTDVVKVCLTDTHLRPLIPIEEQEGLTIFLEKSQQLAIRIGDEIYIDKEMLSEVGDLTAAFTLTHEALHRYFPMDLQQRMVKLRSMNKTIIDNFKKPMSVGDFAFQMEMNDINLQDGGTNINSASLSQQEINDIFVVIDPRNDQIARIEAALRSPTLGSPYDQNLNFLSTSGVPNRLRAEGQNLFAARAIEGKDLNFIERFLRTKANFMNIEIQAPGRGIELHPFFVGSLEDRSKEQTLVPLIDFVFSRRDKAYFDLLIRNPQVPLNDIAFQAAYGEIPWAGTGWHVSGTPVPGSTTVLRRAIRESAWDYVRALLDSDRLNINAAGSSDLMILDEIARDNVPSDIALRLQETWKKSQVPPTDPFVPEELMAERSWQYSGIVQRLASNNRFDLLTALEKFPYFTWAHDSKKFATNFGVAIGASLTTRNLDLWFKLTRQILPRITTSDGCASSDLRDESGSLIHVPWDYYFPKYIKCVDKTSLFALIMFEGHGLTKEEREKDDAARLDMVFKMREALGPNAWLPPWYLIEAIGNAKLRSDPRLIPMALHVPSVDLNYDYVQETDHWTLLMRLLKTANQDTRETILKPVVMDSRTNINMTSTENGQVHVPLMRAIINGDVEIVKLMLARPELVSNTPMNKDNSDEKVTPLFATLELALSNPGKNQAWIDIAQALVDSGHPLFVKFEAMTSLYSKHWQATARKMADKLELRDLAKKLKTLEKLER